MRRSLSQIRFNYGEDGYGILLPHNLVYISSECAEDIRELVFDGQIKIDERGWLPDGVKWKSIDGKIPEIARNDILNIAHGVKLTVENSKQFLPIS